MNDRHVALSCAAMICLIEVVALLCGINGSLARVSVVALAGLGGFYFGKKGKKVSDGKDAKADIAGPADPAAGV